MAITDTQVALLRAQLAGDSDQYHRVLDQIDRRRDNVSFGALVSAAFFEAARRRFIRDNKAADDAEVAEFVAATRRATHEFTEKIDTDAAERSINFVLGKLPFDANDDIDHNIAFQVKFLLLVALVSDEQFSGQELDHFMNRARELAEKSLS